MTKPKVLFLCTGNSCRSQMAEGLLRNVAGDRLEVLSAGTKPSFVHPLAIAVMSELGIDLSKHRSKSIEEFVGEEIDIVVTVCDSAKESCPVFPAKTKRLHLPFEDPADAKGTEEEKLSTFRRIRDQIQKKLTDLFDQQSFNVR